MNSRRVFFGISVPDIYKAELSTLLQEHGLTRLRPENWHITLLFLSSVPDDVLDVWKGLKLKSPPFSCEFQKLKVTRGRQPMLWLTGSVPSELKQLTEELKTLAIDHQLSIDNREFLMHVTLFRSRQAREIPKSLYHLEFERNCTVNEIVLYESLLSKEGSKYQKLASFALAT